MEFPLELRSEVERLLSAEDGKALAAAADGLSKRYRGNDGSGKRLATSRRDILAYAAVRMPATFGAVSRALELTLPCLPEDMREFGSVLDIGAGTGAASHAAFAAAECGEFTCIEREPEMLSVGRQLTEACGIPAQWKQGDITAGFDEKAELVLCSYCLNELSEGPRKAAVKRLWESTQNLLLIVEPGTPEGYSRIMSARGMLLEMGAHIAAPCPAEGECPLAEGDWCHFTVRVPRSRLHKQLKGGDVPYEDEKFSFIAAFRGEPERRSGRVLRHPRVESGKITLELCTPDGAQQRVVTRKSPLFKQARKSAAGDDFPAEK